MKGRLYLFRAHLQRVALAVKQDETFDEVSGGILRSVAEVSRPCGVSN
jgi:hypothetical protein